jgi:hypothetical protein
MSLDVYLFATKRVKCSQCGHEELVETEYELFSANITHNLAKMAREARIYMLLWRPEEVGINLAGELIDPLRAALADMKARPEYYRQFDAPNGWGTYYHFVPWLEEYLQACVENPEAVIRVSR